MLKAIINGNSSNYEFVRRSRCGPINENQQHPRVCCGKYGGVYRAIVSISKNHGSLGLYCILIGPIYESTTAPLPTTTLATTDEPDVDLFPKQCGLQDVVMDSRIVGGSRTRLGQYPWMVRLRHMNAMGRKTYSCSGFLIAPKYVLTAAHCVWSQALERLGPVYVNFF